MWVEKLVLLTYVREVIVILLVRMWVEKTNSVCPGIWVSSSSLWGCELKNLSPLHKAFFFRHPPCEDVSWKAELERKLTSERVVILLVRMWVEKTVTSDIPNSSASSSLWGCELKKSCKPFVSSLLMSSSLWGCELKKSCKPFVTSLLMSSSLWGCELKMIERSCAIG